ncbi:hypothetical protein LPTSP3_g12080 [Leptospira kobayashii]|uniref:Dolichyl-phosphate-mannose-protein mannosyltransferase n=1 Tax=Leptospira kobayashii TaxID=1917830 RepID=A0ABN6KBM1_9LEPT|nr:hypothetical protein LPTSP3_g12080 [Leptospira kobayashii]
MFVGSDPEIKLYQVEALRKGTNFSEKLQCYFPAKDLGFETKQIPIGYPWAFFKKDGTCYFQYPVLFTLVQSSIGFLFPIHWMTYIPILFFFLNLILTDKLLRELGVKEKISIVVSILIHFFSFLFLSTLDYSELTLTNFFALISVLSYFRIEKSPTLLYNLAFAFSVNFSFQLRPEVTIGIVFFIIVHFLLSGNKRTWIRNHFLSGIIAVLVLGCISFFNYKLYGHVFGMRGMNTIQDVDTFSNRSYIGSWIADLWGSESKIGIFKGYPLFFVFLSGIFFLKRTNVISKSLFLSGLLFIFLVPILSPYRAGVDIFGMRYYEIGAYLTAIGFFSLYLEFPKQKPIHFLLILSLLTSMYFGYKSDLRAIRIWKSSAEMYHVLKKEINTAKPMLIVHRGLSLSYLMGGSYLEIPQVVAYTENDWIEIQEKSKSLNLKQILFLFWPGNSLYNEEIPKSIWKTKFDLSWMPSEDLYETKEEISVFHIRMKQFVLKSER